MDLQYRKSGAGHWYVSRKAAAGPRLSFVDDTGSDCLVHLCGTDVGNVIHGSIHVEAVVCGDGLERRAPWRTYDRAGGLAQNWNGQTRLALCVRLVFCCATVVAVAYTVEYECKPRAQGAGRIRTILQLLLEVLVVTDDAGGNGVLATSVCVSARVAEQVDTKCVTRWLSNDPCASKRAGIRTGSDSDRVCVGYQPVNEL